MTTMVADNPNLRAARMAYARARKADPSGKGDDARQAASTYALERGRAALAELLERANDLTRADAKAIADALRDLADEIDAPD